ncbi:MAG: glycosyltransferase family 9 protein [Chthoniobacterales bacterium]
MSRILVIRGGAIGDFILTLPAIRLLRDAFPAAHLEILGYPHIVALAQMSGYADATRSIEYGPLAGFFARESELAPDLVEYFAGFQQVISYLFDPDQIFANNLKRAGVRNFIAGSPKVGDQEHAARHLARPLERLALYLDDPAAVIVPNGKRAIDQALIAIHAGSGSAVKNWPLERFMELGAALLKAGEKTRLLLVSGEADADRVTRLAASLPSEKVRLLSNRPLPELAAALQNCGLFLGHDSGISHLAAAVGVPCLLLFGPTDPAIWAPTNLQVRVLRAPSLTMDGISLADVMAAVDDALRATRG